MLRFIAENFSYAYLGRNLTLVFFLLIILAARVLLSRFPAKYRYILWAVFAFKIIFDLGFSIQNIGTAHSASEQTADVITADAFEGEEMISSGQEQAILIVNGQDAAGTDAASRESAAKRALSHYLSVFAGMVSPALFYIWLAGLLAISITGYINYFRFMNRIRLSVKIGRGLYSCDYIDSPVAVGFIKPGVYIPSGYDPEFLLPSIEHERVHIRRKDTLYKLLAYILLSVYWMNPFAWIAFRLFNLDMEISCDEAVLKNAEQNKVSDYARLLLYFASKGRFFDPASAAFGTTDIEMRVKNMKNKKMIGAVSALAVLTVVAVLGVSFIRLPGSDVQAVASPEEVSQEETDSDEVSAEEITSEFAEEADTVPVDLYDPDINPEDLNGAEVERVITGNNGWVWPVQGASYITAGFGERTRLSENGEETVMHDEVDIAAEPGRTILCARTGSVAEAGFNDELGNYIIIKSDGGVSVTYSHLEECLVSVGDQVSAGAEIGTLGSTGRSTGPHLGFMITIDSVPTDPMQYFS